MILQLRATDAFTELISRFRRAHAIILCEGSTEVEVVKAVNKRLNMLDGEVRVAITDCEGINTLRKKILPFIVRVIAFKVLSKARVLGVVLDAEDLSPNERVRGITNGLRSRNVSLTCDAVNDNVWRITLSNDRTVIVAVSGVMNYEWFTKHTIEDHILLLKELEGLVDSNTIRNVKEASTLVSRNDLQLINNASTDNIKTSFKHVVKLLELIREVLTIHKLVS